MEKIWYLKEKYGGKFFKKEKDLLKDLSTNDKRELYIFNVETKMITNDYLKQRDRDNQLRHVLGELDNFEINAVNLINMYSELAPDGKIINSYRRFSGHTQKTFKENFLNKLKIVRNDKKAFSNFLISNKKHIFTSIDSINWILLVLKCHNFRSHEYDNKKWDRVQKKYIFIDTSNEQFRNNFKEAKKLLKNG